MPVRPEYYFQTSNSSPFYAEQTVISYVPQSRDELFQSVPLPTGWQRNTFGPWEGWTPRDWTPRLQGWKIHISSTPACAVETLRAATEILLKRGVAFKFLPSLSELTGSNAKHADRGGAGKFITIYPDSDEQFAELLEELEAALAGQEGPYILNDLRFRDAPVYVRYGGILLLEMPQGIRRIPAVVSPATMMLRPDSRTPRFQIPADVQVPDVLTASIARSAKGATSRLNEFAELKPLHFSNAGGVYKATLPDGTVRVLREARPHAGLDARNRCAVQRQLQEERILTDLIGCDGVQQLVGTFTAWEHRYLELDYIDGVTLNSWSVMHIDQLLAEPAAYAERLLSLSRQLIDIVERVHERGWTVGDLHPGNVMVGPDDRVQVLDFEDAIRVDGSYEVGFRVFEYASPDHFSPAEADWYAVARSLMSCAEVDWPVEIVAPDYWDRCLGAVEAKLGPEMRAVFDDLARRYPASRHGMSPADTVSAVDSGVRHLDGLIDGLLGGVDWSRRFSDDGSYPGDPLLAGERRSDAFQTGRAGIVWLRNRLGREQHTADVEALRRAARTWDESESPGLYTGLAGIAVALCDAGERDAAVEVARRALVMAEGRPRIDLYEGLVGVTLAALSVAADAHDQALLARAHRSYERLCEGVADGGPWQGALTHRRGLYFGLTGMALADVVAAVTVEGEPALERARARIRAEIDACVEGTRGELHVHDIDGGRVLPYVEWGSAGVWAVANLVERVSGRDVLTPVERAAFFKACDSDIYVYTGFDHGRAGIIAALSTDPDVRDEAERQSDLLRDKLLHHEGHLFLPGDGLIRLSSDLGTGAAGAALALHCLEHDRPFDWLPVTGHVAEHLADAARGVPVSGRGVRQTVLPTAVEAVADTADAALAPVPSRG